MLNNIINQRRESRKKQVFPILEAAVLASPKSPTFFKGPEHEQTKTSERSTPTKLDPDEDLDKYLDKFNNRKTKQLQKVLGIEEYSIPKIEEIINKVDTALNQKLNVFK
jgi:hypothetical protein